MDMVSFSAPSTTLASSTESSPSHSNGSPAARLRNRLMDPRALISVPSRAEQIDRFRTTHVLQLLIANAYQ